MAEKDLTFVDILTRKRVKLTLKTASYFGLVQRINPNKTVTLTDVVDVKDGRRFPGVKVFFGHEIVNVEFCGETSSSNGEMSIAESKGMLNVEEFQPYKKNINFDNDDDDDDANVNFEVIDEFNEKFGPAVMHIKKQGVIGVAAEGVESFQHGRLCWLQIATKNRVYLFDILLLGAQAFKNGLSMILQSTRILKVKSESSISVGPPQPSLPWTVIVSIVTPPHVFTQVLHDCRGVASSLLTQFGVNLTNVFDTQVADVLCFSSETGGFLPDRVSTLQEVVSLYLKVPSSRLSSLQMKTRLTKEEREMWYVRPCPLPLLKVMTLAVIHLQPLRLVLLDAMMSDYVALVDSYLSSSLKEPGDVGHITMSSVLELPRELRELEHILRDRQRFAIGHFNVTQNGLLDRYNPLSQTPPKATPPSTTLPITTPLSQTLPITTPLSQTLPISTPLSQTLPITTPLSQTPPKATPPSTTLPITTPLSQTPPITTPLSQTPPKATPPSTTLPIITPLSQTLPITTPLSQTLPIITPLSQTPPITTPLSQTLPITTPLSQTPPKATPLSTTLPITTPLSQTLPIITPLSQTPPITTPLSQTPPKATPPSTTLPITTSLSETPPTTTPLSTTLPISTPLLKTTPPVLEASWNRMAQIKADAANHVTHAEPPAITRAVGLHIQEPTSSPQVTRVSSLQSTTLTPSAGPAPPLAAAPRLTSSLSDSRMRELMLGIIGRGRPLSKAPQAPLAVLPSLGRGFLLQMTPASSPGPNDGFPPGASRDNQMSPSVAGDTAGPCDLSAAGVLRGNIPALGRGWLKPSINPLSSQSFASFMKM
ncbi:piRNA biogenesis protein EXD1 [Merluccius polli]|uniref:PiRNA biogenesis protein EXD1 n=1 Tax=Merluccius polli TaxID=89951 RepID=A0AA47NVG0_MERPO|nr:piRNA biogenesis protein EXD1 [Merluccius polli]